MRAPPRQLAPVRGRVGPSWAELMTTILLCMVDDEQPASEATQDRWTRLAPHAADALAAIVLSSDDAIYSKDRDALITSWNPAAERLYGWSVEEAIGSPIRMIIPDSRRGEETRFLNRVLGGGQIDHFETERVRKDGSIVQVSVSISPVHDANGNIVQAAVVARDITAQRQLTKLVSERSRKQALELNDEVVQGLAAAKLALETGKTQHGLQAVEQTLARAKTIVTALLAEASEPLGAGDLVRDRPANLGSDDGA